MDKRTERYFRRRISKCCELNMLSQEHLYQWLVSEDWKAILKFLHENKGVIRQDNMLSTAARVVEDEFVRKLSENSQSDCDILEILETFYILNYGDFYGLKEENLEIIYNELAKRSPEQYAQLSTENRRRSLERQQDNTNIPDNIVENSNWFLSAKWIEIYNRLFEIIDVKHDAETYFSGPRFLNLIRKYMPYFPDYLQYIKTREISNQSTSRRQYFFDIFSEIGENHGF